MEWINLLLTFLPLVILVIAFILIFNGKFFGRRTYNQMMDESFQRLDRIEQHTARIAVSLEQIATALQVLAQRPPDQDVQ